MVIRVARKGNVEAVWIDTRIPDRYTLKRILTVPRLKTFLGPHVLGTLLPQRKQLLQENNDAIFHALLSLCLRHSLPESSADPRVRADYLIPDFLKPHYAELREEVMFGDYAASLFRLLRYGPRVLPYVHRARQYRQILMSVDAPNSEYARGTLEACVTNLGARHVSHNRERPAEMRTALEAEINTMLEVAISDYNSAKTGPFTDMRAILGGCGYSVMRLC